MKYCTQPANNLFIVGGLLASVITEGFDGLSVKEKPIYCFHAATSTDSAISFQDVHENNKRYYTQPSDDV